MSAAARRTRTAILISGRGSNMVALIEAAQVADFPAEIVLVAANLPEAGGLERAAAAGIATASVDHRPFGKDREAFERALDEVLRANQIELIALAGFMRVLTPWFVTRWQGRLINIHPSLLPDFRGTHTHARALEAGVAEHGCTVHFVVPELDAGPTILQAKVPVLPGDDEASLSARVLEQEHKIYPQALALVASGTVKLDGVAVGV
ncbi:MULTISPECIES: phosphoribosylglycinamide formyltransferase [unclassified Bosea (in: a-proteobacteria)]|uniref:phosphoribosylglycinamide formyltransferase n=1 Tax=unclassified Bosea (in: a-proteobacteria) TaxID=2653178 RepID=UPI000F761F49|nr:MULTISPECIES: phosphoribosylglycinamide formyltransferase [unclassified Bosea (in: a-proteobacteria)]AZO77622.1 phosphoribosylglycinamide formyltransferase [Bosea sp. Tri-49]RXT18228.1 phosphoribosylglycinamide formyltransferase [Bosea sp. Tri-39]RXT32824.1 phosphoribosylglycinamide formyltransferase [Bosea sp. Tri-54]